MPYMEGGIFNLEYNNINSSELNELFMLLSTLRDIKSLCTVCKVQFTKK